MKESQKVAADMGGGVVAAVVLAATPTPRAPFAACWASLVARPVVAWSLDVVSASPAIDEVVLVVPPARLAFARELTRAMQDPAIRVVAVPQHSGGTWICQLRVAVETLAPAVSHIVAHEGARPLLSPALLDCVLTAGTTDGGGAETIAVAGVPVKETLKLVDAAGEVRQTPARTDLRQLQSPILLPRAVLTAALATDETTARGGGLDALLAVCAGCRTHVVPGSYDNLLIRTPQDLALAADLLRRDTIEVGPSLPESVPEG